MKKELILLRNIVIVGRSLTSILDLKFARKTNPPIKLLPPNFHSVFMSPEKDLEFLHHLTGFLWNHNLKVIRDTVRSIHEIEGVILRDHQPSFRRELREPRFGYNCFDGAREQTLKRLLNDLKAVLRPVQILLEPKGPSSTLLNSVSFSPEEILELRGIAAALGNLVVQERLIGYIPYMLYKFRTVPEWRHSRYAKMKWTETNLALVNGNESLDHLLSKVANCLGYDTLIVKKWVQLGCNVTSNDGYITRCLKIHDTDNLHHRVWRDEVYLEYITINDDLETKAYILAFQTFRMEWFTILGPGYCEFTGKARRWLSTDKTCVLLAGMY